MDTMTMSTAPAEIDTMEQERAEIQRHVANFRRHQAEMQARRDARWDRATEEIRERVAEFKQ